MSELSKLQKELKETEQFLCDYKSSSSSSPLSSDKDHRLVSIAESFLSGSVHDRCESYRHKMKLKDPVTGDARFGPVTMQKIEKMLGQYYSLSKDLEKLLPEAKQKMQQKDENRDVKKPLTAAERIEQSRINKDHPAPQSMDPLSIFRPDIATDHHVMAEKGNDEHQNRSDVKEKAEAIRLQKRSRAEQEAIDRLKENRRISQICRILSDPRAMVTESSSSENTRKEVVMGTSVIRGCLQDLADSVKRDEAEQMEQYGLLVEANGFQGAVEIVQKVLTNIIAHPDDEMLRKIRVNHPAIRDRLTKYGLSSIKLLTALGFRAKPVLASGDAIPDEDVQLGLGETDTSDVPGISSDEISHAVKKAVEAEHPHGKTRLSILLVMTEPSTETMEGMEKWKDWFDGLHSSLDAVANFEQKH